MLLLAHTLFLTHHSSSQNPLEAMSRTMTNQEETSTILPISVGGCWDVSGGALSGGECGRHPPNHKSTPTVSAALPQGLPSGVFSPPE